MGPGGERLSLRAAEALEALATHEALQERSGWGFGGVGARASTHICVADPAFIP